MPSPDWRCPVNVSAKGGMVVHYDGGRRQPGSAAWKAVLRSSAKMLD
jgi:hypothetical protein